MRQCFLDGHLLGSVANVWKPQDTNPIGVPFSFANLEPWLSNPVFRKVSLGRLKVPYNGLWCSTLRLIKSVHLVRNAHEEGWPVLNIKLDRVPEGDISMT